MRKEKLSLRFSPEESKTLLKALYKSLGELDKKIKFISYEIVQATSTLPLDNEIAVKRMSDARNTVAELRAIYSVKLKFVQSMEEALEDDENYIAGELSIIRNNKVDEDCKNCAFFSDEIEDCTLARWRKEKCLQMKK